MGKRPVQHVGIHMQIRCMCVYVYMYVCMCVYERETDFEELAPMIVGVGKSEI